MNILLVKLLILLNLISYLCIIIQLELGYGAVRSTDGLCATDRFSVFKVQMIDPTGYNILHMKI
jgi:hypothetical protein